MELNNLIKDEAKNLVSDFLSNDKNDVKLPFLPLIEYAHILSEFNFSTLTKSSSINLMNEGNDWDNNGWQVDFWWTIFRDNQKYILSGSLFYGRITLSKSDE